MLAGGWDALASERADLVIGASGDPPSGGGFATVHLGRIQFVFVAAPFHPINKEPQPLTEASILRYRAVSVADTSRNLLPRTVGLISGQDVLTLPSMSAKVAAHVAGLGVGFLPSTIAAREVAAGRLTILPVEIAKPGGDVLLAWRPNRTGKALRWFVDRLQQPGTIDLLLEVQPGSPSGNANPPVARSAKSK